MAVPIGAVCMSGTDQRGDHDSGDLLVMPARVLVVDGERATPEALLEVAKKAAPDPSVFDERPPFYWGAEISSNRLDAYSTVMEASTLRNFAQDATAGVAFMNSHRTGGFLSGAAELPLGRSVGGRFIGGQGNGLARTMADFYAVRGLNLNGISTDDLIDGMRSGVVSDVSVGFSGGEVCCSICKRDMRRDPECWHMPGIEYDLRDDEGHKTGQRAVAVGSIENARLNEVSAVWDGATPGAKIVEVKVPREIEAGRMRADTVSLLEQRFRIRLPHPARSFAGAVTPAPPKEEDRMDLTPEELATIRLALTETGAPADAAIPATVSGLVEEIKSLRALPAEIDRLRPLADEAERLRPLADEGRAYRADLVAQALAEGVRAMGAEFAEETYRGLLESASLDTVKRLRDDWKATGDRVFPGGRLTKDDAASPTPIATGKRRAPRAAFRA